MDKILAIVILLLFVWLAIPRLIHGQWITPTAVPPNSWVVANNYPGGTHTSSSLAASASTPTQGFGWFRFDFWNHSSPEGQPATSNDVRLRPVRYEFH